MNVNIGSIKSLSRAGGTQTNGTRVVGQMGRKIGAERKGKEANLKLLVMDSMVTVV